LHFVTGMVSNLIVRLAVHLKTRTCKYVKMIKQLKVSRNLKFDLKAFKHSFTQVSQLRHQLMFNTRLSYAVSQNNLNMKRSTVF